MVKSILRKLVSKLDLGEADILDFLKKMEDGHVKDTQLCTFITAMEMKGITPEEAIVFYKKFESQEGIYVPKERNVMDLVGTGGDLFNSFPVGTASVFISSAAGVKVIKHSHQAPDFTNGSADVLRELGVNLNLSVQQKMKMIEKAGLIFTFKIVCSGTLCKFLDMKKDLGFRNFVHIIETMISPIKTNTRFVGTYSEESASLVANTLAKNSVERALVVHGLQGLDEFSSLGKTKVFEVNKEKVTEKYYIPEDFLMKKGKVSDLSGGKSNENAIIIKGILEGARGPKADVVALNAGAQIYLAGKARTIEKGVEQAIDLMVSGKALEQLNKVVELSKEFEGESK